MQPMSFPGINSDTLVSESATSSCYFIEVACLSNFSAGLSAHQVLVRLFHMFELGRCLTLDIKVFVEAFLF